MSGMLYMLTVLTIIDKVQLKNHEFERERERMRVCLRCRDKSYEHMLERLFMCEQNKILCMDTWWGNRNNSHMERVRTS